MQATGAAEATVLPILLHPPHPHYCWEYPADNRTGLAESPDSSLREARWPWAAGPVPRADATKSGGSRPRGPRI